MELRVVFQTARSVTIETITETIYEFDAPGQILVNGENRGETKQVVFTLFDLKPDMDYNISLERNGEKAEVNFHTDYEFVTINVREVGALGDGIQNDTPFIQAAIMACPKDGRVLIPAGTYKVTSLFLKSHIKMELSEGAELLAETDRYQFPKFPGMIESYDEKDDYNLGTWEGNPLPMFAGIITGIDVEDVVIYGRGIINGQASFDNWWDNVRVMKGAFRPRMVFLERCRKITLQGFSLKNSPTWVLHPYFSEDLKFLNLSISNPADSPNTDGLDPESCKDVEILGLHFSLGDDCIAIKSGKIYMGRRYKKPSENITIRQCLMENGHGAVTIGSEVGAGVKNILVERCLFRHTDRGLRIKTRRGRGKDSVLTDITFDHIDMDHVMTPFVVNGFYFCDPDGKSEYVQCRESLPVDDRTPEIGRFSFTNIKAANCHVAASFLYGLPEKKIERIEFKNVAISFAKEAKSGAPAMLSGVGECTKKGFCISNVDTLICENVHISGQEGEAFELSNINHYETI
ncbi:glycoside hydrolase family 28 protein [Lacrimispora defluvii]|uniref:Glycoside hydrolase family 28 protein n=1 Tax=Lacrimispora defluvii TaxID=2719233 RepID=A0ABX1VXR9_9FIRM|nr:glycoside hydrolase family 28 protein [Lacrimispora defluvii]NNJ32180.1 glycoside hydrolase family 28 protein [Lacrimispora defluvii]